MANEIPVEKINIRNPFFISADAEGAPDAPDAAGDPIDNPEVPDLYVSPSQVTENVICGQEVNIGEDVGGKIYTLNVGKATGNVTIDYTVNVPISITGYWNTTTPNFSSTGYVGNDIFEQDLLDAGVSAGNMNLGSGVQTGTVTINKTAETPETVNFLVSAPLRTDDYQLTFNCPSAPAITAPVSNIPSTIPSHTSFFEQIPAFFVELHSTDLFDLQIRVNNSVVQNITSSGVYVFTDYDGVSNSFGIKRELAKIGASDQGYVQGLNGCVSDWTTPTTYFAQSDYFNTNTNRIEIIVTPKSGGSFPSNFWNNSPKIRYIKSGLFYDNVNSNWRYPLHSTIDAGGFQWGAKYQQSNTQNDDTTFISAPVTLPTTISPYRNDSFFNYGLPNKISFEFHWRSTSPAGLNNPTIGSNAYYQQFKGRTYRVLLDDGAALQETAILNEDLLSKTSTVKGCFS
jgi:hypothetical protein